MQILLMRRVGTYSGAHIWLARNITKHTKLISKLCTAMAAIQLFGVRPALCTSNSTSIVMRLICMRAQLTWIPITWPLHSKYSWSAMPKRTACKRMHNVLLIHLITFRRFMARRLCTSFTYTIHYRSSLTQVTFILDGIISVHSNLTGVCHESNAAQRSVCQRCPSCFIPRYLHSSLCGLLCKP